MAVDVQGVSKSYSARLEKSTTVLKDVHVHVQVGHVYGVLGPSGCGKTTLLHCILGQLKVDTGRVLVFGKPPGTPGLGVPGPRVGFMPQEIALISDLTIVEALRYFGRLLLMPADKIQSRTLFLLDLLHLPKETRIVKKLSGGQQRRLSFACALIHEPELLILDEPTVGVDPLLRKSIWEHFMHLAKETNCTIIITTHYIEEASNADMIAFMRHGRIIAEASPESLIQTHQMQTLEDVFCALCNTEDNLQKSERRSTETVKPSWDESNSTIEYNFEKVKSSSKFCPNYSRMTAVFCKNIILMRRNPILFLLLMLLPVVDIVLCSLIFDNFSGLSISYVNDDVGTFGQLYLQHLSTDAIELTRYSTKLAAEDAVRRGDSWATVLIQKNFSASITERFRNGVFADEMAINGSEINVQMDMTNLQIVYILADEILQAYLRFTADTLKKIGINPNIGTPQIKFSDNIYNTGKASFNNFISAAVIVVVTFYLACGAGVMVLVMERSSGVWDRNRVTGLTEVELVLSHFAFQFLLLCGQLTLALIYVIFISTLPCKGPVIVLILLLLLQGVCGISFGLFLSGISKTIVHGAQYFLAAMYYQLYIGGFMWPLEGMPTWLRYISYALPQTYATDAARSIMSRGWSLQYQTVWLSVVITISWIVIFMFSSMTVLRLRR